MFLLVLLSRLPLRVLYVISDFLYFMCYYVIQYRGDVIMKNLRNSFPEKSEKELRQIQKTFYKNFCDFGVETLRFRTISNEELQRRVTFSGVEKVQPYADAKQPVLYLLSHQFN